MLRFDPRTRAFTRLVRRLTSTDNLGPTGLSNVAAKPLLEKCIPESGLLRGGINSEGDYDVSSCIDRCNIEVYPNDPDDPNDDKRIQRTGCRHGCTIMGCYNSDWSPAGLRDVPPC